MNDNFDIRGQMTEKEQDNALRPLRFDDFAGQSKIVSKHAKPSPKHPQGGIVKQEAGVHISNLQVVDPKTGAPTRIGRKVVDGKNVRYAKKSGEEIK